MHRSPNDILAGLPQAGGSTPFQRSEGAVRLEAAGDGGATRIGLVRQSGSGRIRFPRQAGRRSIEAIVLNTAGGLAGGDHFTVAVALEGGAALVTTQACEKAYRCEADAPPAIVEQELWVRHGGVLRWLPQPAIVFDRARLRRLSTFRLDGAASLLAFEGLILGREAMGETVREGLVEDRLRVVRDGTLVFADSVRLGGDIAGLASRRAGLAGGRAFATMLLVAPDAHDRLGAARAAAEGAAAEMAASAWNGMMVVRFLADAGDKLIASVARTVECLGLGPMPRTWSI